MPQLISRGMDGRCNIALMPGETDADARAFAIRLGCPSRRTVTGSSQVTPGSFSHTSSGDLIGIVKGGVEGYLGGGGWGGAARGAAGAASGIPAAAINCANSGGQYNFTTGSCSPQGGTGGSPLVPGGQDCPEGQIRIFGSCVNLRALPPGGQPAVHPVPGTQVGGGGYSPTYGQYGVGVEPAAVSQIRYDCPDGMVLGKDNVCYNKRDLRRSERKWNPGRKPMLTGGDLNALSRARRLEKKLATLTRKAGFNVRTKAAAAAARAREKSCD